MKKQKKKPNEMELVIPFDKCKRYITRWLDGKPEETTTAYVELPVKAVKDLLKRNSRLLNKPDFIRIYIGINDDERLTAILVAANTENNQSVEIADSNATYGENFGTLCPPYNAEGDPNSLASIIHSEIHPHKKSTKKTVRKKKK